MKIITGYTGVAHVTSGDAASLNRGIFGSNNDLVLGGIGNELSYETSGDETSITINTGDVVIDGVHARVTSPETLSLDNGTRGQYRVDLVVAHYYKNASTAKEYVELKVIKGTAGSSPVDPSYSTGNIGEGALTRDAVLYRIVRYDVGIQSITKVIGTYYQNTGNSPMVVKSTGEGYAQLGSYDSSTEGNAAYLEATDENKNTAARLVIYESGKIGFMKGDTFVNIPITQTGVITVGNGSTTITFPHAYKDVPVVVASSSDGNNPVAINAVSATNVSIRVTIASGSRATVRWIAVGNQLA